MHPFLHISEHLQVPVYLLLISLSYCVCLFWLGPRAKKIGVSPTKALDLSFVIMVSGFIGARLLHIIYEEPQYYLDKPFEVFKFWKGGFVFYGGFLGTLFGGYLFVRLKKLSFMAWADFFAPMGALGYAIGRLGCFFNGCCYGQICELPWAVQFPGLSPLGIARHPTQLYAVAWEVLTLLLLLNLEKMQKLKTGQLFSVWIFLHSIGRLLMEQFRDDPRGDLLFSVSISSWISLALFSFSIILFKKSSSA